MPPSMSNELSMPTPLDSPPTGRLTGAIHHYPVRVYYEDTDAGGIVYHANYLRFAERARTEMLRCVGFAHNDLIGEHRVMLAVRSLEIDYVQPARLDDALAIVTKILAVGGASIKLSQLVFHLGAPDRVCSRIRLRLACIDGNARPARLPEDFLARALALIVKE
jgi:acyl-CoA thioester hydrolase